MFEFDLLIKLGKQNPPVKVICCICSSFLEKGPAPVTFLPSYPDRSNLANA
jgi:hypothetical protein